MDVVLIKRRRKWIWICLFIVVAIAIASLATGWNVVLIRDYDRLFSLARSFRLGEGIEPPAAPWISIAFGSLGFGITLAGLTLFFVRLLQEMRLNQLQSEFLASVSHALKTPIATIELSSTLLRSGDISPETAVSLWESFDAELRRLKEDVDTLLEATRWQSSSSVKVHPVSMGMENWIQDSLTRWKNILGPKATLERIGPELTCEVSIDPRLLHLILDNLMDNARKFSRDDPRVILRTELLPADKPWSKPHWKLHVCDQGWGFDPEDKKRLFQKFYRSKVDAPYAIGGTGLGLYLASSASHALGLSLDAWSEGHGHGAIFTVEGECR